MVDKVVSFGKDIAAELKKTDEWACTTAANSKDNRATDCNALLSNSTGLPEFIIGPSCCYEWRGSVNATTLEEDPKVKEAAELFEKAGYPIKDD